MTVEKAAPAPSMKGRLRPRRHQSGAVVVSKGGAHTGHAHGHASGEARSRLAVAIILLPQVAGGVLCELVGGSRASCTDVSCAATHAQRHWGGTHRTGR